MLELVQNRSCCMRKRIASCGHTAGPYFPKGSLTGFWRRGHSARFPKEEITFFENPEDVVALLNSRLTPGDWILVKGSRKMKMEAVAEKIIEAFDLKPQTL